MELQEPKLRKCPLSSWCGARTTWGPCSSLPSIQVSRWSPPRGSSSRRGPIGLSSFRRLFMSYRQSGQPGTGSSFPACSLTLQVMTQPSQIARSVQLDVETRHPPTPIWRCLEGSHDISSWNPSTAECDQFVIRLTGKFAWTRSCHPHSKLARRWAILCRLLREALSLHSTNLPRILAGLTQLSISWRSRPICANCYRQSGTFFPPIPDLRGARHRSTWAKVSPHGLACESHSVRASCTSNYKNAVQPETQR